MAAAGFSALYRDLPTSNATCCAILMSHAARRCLSICTSPHDSALIDGCNQRCRVGPSDSARSFFGPFDGEETASSGSLVPADYELLKWPASTVAITSG